MKKYYYLVIRLWKLLKPFHKHFYLQLVAIIFLQINTVALVYLLANFLNSTVARDFNKALLFLISWFGFSIIELVLNYLSAQNSIKNLGTKIQQFLQEYSFKKVFNLNGFQYVEDHSAIKLQVIDKGENAIESIIRMIVLEMFPVITQVIFSLIAITYFSPKVAIICIFVFIIGIIWTQKFTNFHRPYVRKDRDNWDEQRKIRTEAFQHLSLIKIFAANSEYLKKYLKDRFASVEHNILMNMLRLNYGHKRWLFFNIGRFSSLLILLFEFSKNLIQIGHVYAVFSWVNTVFSNIHTILQVARDLPIRFIELEKYLDIIDKKPEFNESGEKNFRIGNIIFNNVSFKYPKGENTVIENLNFEIKEGQKIAFVGFSGSGKSTIAKLLLRIYDYNHGEILLNNKNIRELDAEILRKKIGYVEQHIDLFDTSIKENILFGIDDNSQNKNINEEKLSEIIHKARINQFFHRLGEKGLDTIIGERGIKLSGGERQRIGIARALIKDPEILIFDEATASLDTENEKYIQEAIDESTKGKTTIIIAHRLSTVQNADKIFVMDKGKIVGIGTHDELKEHNEKYKRLIKSQEN